MNFNEIHAQECIDLVRLLHRAKNKWEAKTTTTPFKLLETDISCPEIDQIVKCTHQEVK